MITVHHLNNSRSNRVLWTLEELGLPYQIEQYQRDPVTMLAPESLKKIHPLGKAPVLTDGEWTIAESAAILEYLQETYDHSALLKPQEKPERMQYRYWLHYAEGSLMPLLVMKLIFNRLGKAPVPWLIRPIGSLLGKGVQRGYLDQQLATHLRFIENHLSKNNWFAGDHFSLADIQMSFPLEAMNIRTGLDKAPHARGLLKRLHARPAYLLALEKGGPLELMD
ncbi:MAG: glutathione S-transferase family protein [Hafnia alvei]|uniref:glutathione S-transferase family protein n=1 Tax=Hafnia alvei TaxID=569 RepID=UPI003F90AB05